uniref:60S ribosomal protein L18a-like protein n=1 Tax=Nelumbo nucifera TaxID=4432 RepID=A0A822YVK8_NELNU|nr:TPA_asm: hypothetical protein HUJ06_007363 [Nelumbo nucifera]
MEEGGHEHRMVVVQHQPFEGKRSLLEPGRGDHPGGLYDEPLSCFGCGFGWFFFLLGFVFPLLWYCATVLYFGSCLKDPRERAGLAASAIAALICSVVLLILLLAMLC